MPFLGQLDLRGQAISRRRERIAKLPFHAVESMSTLSPFRFASLAPLQMKGERLDV